MYLLNALNNYKKDKKSALKCSEYEVLCRVHLTGILDLGAIYLQFWELPPDLEKNRYDVRAVYLKTFTSQEDIAKELSAKNKQYYQEVFQMKSQF